MTSDTRVEVTLLLLLLCAEVNHNVVHSRDIEGVGTAHKLNSRSQSFLDDNGAVLVKCFQIVAMEN